MRLLCSLQFILLTCVHYDLLQDYLIVIVEQIIFVMHK